MKSFYIGGIMRSLQRQREININWLAGGVPKTPLSFAGLELRALQILSPHAFACVAGGAGRDTTIDPNRQALDQIKIHPPMLGGVQEVRMQLKWREYTLPALFMVARILLPDHAISFVTRKIMQLSKLFFALWLLTSCNLPRKCCPDNFQWSHGNLSPTKFEFECALIYDHKLYVLGGPNRGAFEVFDTKSKKWCVLPSIPQPVYSNSCVILDHAIYVLGGIDTLSNFSDAFQKFDLVQNKWEILPALRTPRSSASAVVCNNKIYLIGGLEGMNNQFSTFSSLVEDYDPTTQSWQRKSDLPTARYGLTSLCLNRNILVAGGILPNGHISAEMTSVVEQFNPLKDTWSRMADLPSPNYLFGLLEIDEKIYAIGGYGYREFSPVIRYDVNADQWMQVGTLPQTMNAFGIAVDGMKVYLVGGKTNGKSIWVGKKLK